MLLRLLGLAVLSVLYLTKDVDGNTEIFNEETLSENFNQRLRRSPEMPVHSAIPPDPSIMFPDTSICDVILNSQENITINKIPFFCMCAHCKSTTGLKGECGDRGEPGLQGSPGWRGLTGCRGLRGSTGPSGVKGQKGEQGDKGHPGRIGFPGMKGTLGVKGEKGDHGDDGPIGSVGPQGIAGSCLCEPTIGPRGRQGPPGSPGARGIPGTTGSKGMPGAKGDKGDMGINARDGADGLKGEQGDSGPCDCADGENGEDGIKGPKGEVGIKGNTGPNGPQGAPGVPGMMGDPGFPGRPGPCSLAVQSAFFVGLQEPFPNTGVVKFKNIYYNVQGHYNPDIGIYVAPTDGTYSCNFHLTVKDKMLVVRLFHNFYYILTMTGTTDETTISHSMILHLKMYDMLWLQVKDLDSNGMYTGPRSTSTFSCFLVRPDSCGSEVFNINNIIWTDLAENSFPWDGISTAQKKK